MFISIRMSRSACRIPTPFSGAGATASTTGTNAVSAACGHPQIVGQAHHMLWYGRLAEYIAGNDGVGSATCDEIAWCWLDDEEDVRRWSCPTCVACRRHLWNSS